jgi:hypothetical protein
MLRPEEDWFRDIGIFEDEDELDDGRNTSYLSLRMEVRWIFFESLTHVAEAAAPLQPDTPPEYETSVHLKNWYVIIC